MGNGQLDSGAKEGRDMSATLKKVSILIPTMFDSRFIIELCVGSIRTRTDYPDYQLIVCDSGADEPTRAYLQELSRNGIIRLIATTDWQRPKDDLVAAVDTDYYVLMHDDIQITRSDWLARRMNLMNRHPRNAIVGTVVKNYRRTARFFPLGLLVKTAASRALGLVWGKQPDKGYDTGALAYQKFCAQDEYRYVPYKTSRDIRHFSEMTWPKYHTPQDYPGLDKKLQERQQKMEYIRKVIEKEKY